MVTTAAVVVVEGAGSLDAMIRTSQLCILFCAVGQSAEVVVERAVGAVTRRQARRLRVPRLQAVQSTSRRRPTVSPMAFLQIPGELRAQSSLAAIAATWDHVYRLGKFYSAEYDDAVVIGGLIYLGGLTIYTIEKYGPAAIQTIKEITESLVNKAKCWKRYLDEKAFCSQYYGTDLYGMCASRARARFEACRDGLDPNGPGPLDPLEWPN